MVHNEAQDKWDFDAADKASTAERFSEAWYKEVQSPATIMRHEDYIAYEWRDVFCMCLSPSGISARDPNGGELPCKRCGKQRRWLYMRECHSCGQPFFFGFTHSEKKRGKCWDCCVREYGQTDKDVSPPKWAHPKVIRPIDEIMNFDFGDEF